IAVLSSLDDRGVQPHSGGAYFDDDERDLYQRYQGIQAKTLRVVIGQWGGFNGATTLYSDGIVIHRHSHEALGFTDVARVTRIGGPEAETGALGKFRGDAEAGTHREYERNISYSELPAEISFEDHGSTHA